MTTIKKFNSLLNFSQKKEVIFLLFLIFIGMFLETLGVGLIIPMFTIIMDPNIANKYPIAATFLSNLSPLNWFFDQWLETSKSIDYKLGKIKKVDGAAIKIEPINRIIKFFILFFSLSEFILNIKLLFLKNFFKLT